MKKVCIQTENKNIVIANNSINVLHSYTNLGILNEKKASKMHNGLDVNIWRQTYHFNAASGNLQSRGSAIFNNVEHFEYDNLHRLKEVLGQNQQQVQEVLYQPNNNGNIVYKSDAGEYFYDSNRPYAIAVLQNPEPALSTQQQDINYTAFNQPLEIEENGFKLKYYYGPDEQRRISELYDEQQNLVKKIYYNGNYELIESNGNTYEVNYLFAPEGLFGIAVKENNNPVQVYYVETDHLGSILGLYNEAGQPVYSQSFDAWGRERNPTDWSYSAGGGSKPAWLIRGYTGHEHLPEPLSPFGGAGGGIINMNGRMYDPILGRMLSPDNFVQAPTCSQSFNRYSYVFNNPLKFTDPSGELAWFVPVAIGFVVGGYFGGVAASGEWNPVSSNYWKDGWEGFVAGGLAGAGLGLGASAGFAAAGANITGISAGVKGFAASGTTTKAWSITSNALITANINMASRLSQGGNLEEIAVSGAIGFGAGAIGGALGSIYSNNGVMSIKGIKTQNYVTNILNGSGDRFYRSINENLTENQNIKNTLWGGIEGAISARFFSTDKKLMIGHKLNRLNNPVLGRYLSGPLSNYITSNPGASLMGARIYGSIYPVWMFGQMNADIATSITMTVTFSPWLYIGLSALQRSVINSNYPYAYDFLDPDY